ncbi:MAG TPA: sulfotransferase [Casimicrobiaceae bacterium]|jgi:hypothetical protein|nr:sulfotransferase [Casimicrobiaceae bacterium]
MATRAIAGRLFVVGCPRSGTTLLQSLFAAHPAALSFPETAVFGRLLSASAMPGEVRLGTIHRRTQLGYRHAMAMLDAMGRRDLEYLLPIRSKSIGQFVDGFIAVLDHLTLDKGKSWWVEKTPENVRFVPEILELVPGAKFVNTLRDGRQNVAALYDMARKYPDRWWVRFRDLDLAIDMWNRSARHARLLLGMPGVLLIRHERLLSDTEAVMQEVCCFAGLPFTRQMFDRRVESARAVITAREPWKAEVLTPIRSGIEDRFERLFDPEQRAYIEARLEQIDF